MVDFQLEWFKRRLLILLQEEDEAVFTDLIFRDAGRAREKLIAFLAGAVDEHSARERRVVIFYKTLKRQLVAKGQQDDATVAKANRPGRKRDNSSDEDGRDSSSSKSPPSSRTPLMSTSAKSGKGAKKSRGSVQRTSVSSDSKLAGKKGSAKSIKKGRKSPSTVVETLRDDDDKPPEDGSQDTEGESSPEPQNLMGSSTEVVWQPVLHCSFGSLTKEDREQLTETQRMVIFARRNGTVVSDDVAAWEDVEHVMTQSIMIGAFNSTALEAFYLLLDKVVSPLLFPVTSEKGSKQYSLFSKVKDDTESLVQYVKSAVKFNVEKEEKEIMEKINSGEDAGNYRDELSEIIDRWISQIKSHLDDAMKRQPNGEGPTVEVECWAEKEVVLSGLKYSIEESIDLEKICSFAKKASLEKLGELEHEIARVESLLIEARAVTRSCEPLIIYFQDLEGSTLLSKASEILPCLINGLYFLWILCSPYCQDDRMEGMLQRIAWLLCNKVAQILNMDTFFKEGDTRALSKAKEGAHLMQLWKELYFQTRRTIEKAGHANTWEFDLRKLFGDSEYIRAVCIDLTEICKVLIHFRAILNVELKSVISNQTMVDVLLKQVTLLIAPIQQDADFEVFLAVNADSWRSFMNHFRRNVLSLEQSVCIFLDESITRGNLSSSEKTLSLLLNLRSAETRKAVHDLIELKFEVAIRELLDEVHATRKTFLNSKDVPPLLRNQPLNAGAIYWSRNLFLLLKKSVARFKQHEELQDHAMLKEAFAQYVQLVRQIKVYQNEHYLHWTNKAESIINNTMGSNLIKITKKREEKKQRTTAVERRLGSLFASSDGGGQSASDASSRLMLRPVLASLRWVARAVAARKRASVSSDYGLVLPHIGLEPSDASVPSLGLQYEVCIGDDLFLILSEAEMIEDIGYKITPVIRNVAIQRGLYEKIVRSVRESITSINNMLSQLDVAQISLLQFPLKKLERVIEPGIYRLKWISQSLVEYSESLERAVQVFSASYKQFMLCSKNAQRQVDLIQSFNLFYVQNMDGVVPWNEFFKRASMSRDASVKEMLLGYENLSKILVDLEYLLDKTQSGKKECMTKYYLHWEQLFFEALLKAIVGSLIYFSKALSGNVVMLQIDFSLANNDLRLEPLPTEAYSVLMSSAKEVVLTSGNFHRWADGTCIWSTEFTFLDDVAKVEKVKDEYANMKVIAEDVLIKVKQKLYSWKKYSILWSYDKVTTCQKFSAKSPTMVERDDKLAYFTSIVNTMETATKYMDIGCVRVNLGPLVEKIAKHAAEWRWHLAQNIISTSKKEMKQYLWSMWTLQAELEQQVKENDPETLREVIETIVKIRNSNTDREVQAYFIRENYRTISAHNIQIDAQDLCMSGALWSMWQELFEASKKTADKLSGIRKHYSDITLKAAEDFSKKCTELEESFRKSGPGCVGKDLANGELLMEKYKNELDELEERKLKLTADEYLFDLPLSDFSKMKGIQKRMACLHEVYELFNQLKSTKAKWSSTLWVDISPGAFSEGIKEFDAKFASLSSQAQSEEVAFHVKEEINSFKSSIPLFEELKCDALRERHWRSLMLETGNSFNTAADRLSLQNLFDMQLHLHEKATRQILLQAKEESKIETLLETMQKTWQQQDCSVMKLIFRGEDFGLLLGSFDATLDKLKADQLKLHFLSTSIFVKPFLDQVRFWEETLSKIEECIDLWTRIHKNWTNLVVLFSKAETTVHLTEAAQKRFNLCRNMHHKMLKNIAQKPQIISIFCTNGYLNEVRNLSVNLEECQLDLREYLFMKRQIFPRLYFINDSDLTSILASVPPDCFNRIATMKNSYPFISQIHVHEREEEEGYEAYGFTSLHGECISFDKPLIFEEEQTIELLCKLDAVIKEAVRNHIEISVSHVQSFAPDDLLKCPANFYQPALYVYWSKEVEARLSLLGEGDIKALRRFMIEANEGLLKIMDTLKEHGGSCVQKMKLTSAFTLATYFKDVMEQLVHSGVVHKEEFLWDSKLRFYYQKERGLNIRQAFCDLEYGYEFTGLGDTPISTPESDNVILIITQTLCLQMGVLICGYAGTGKSEIIRDLARTLGRHLVTLDCTNATPWPSVAHLLAGVAQSGFWGCLKQLDSLAPSSLSVIASQLQTLKTALVMKLRTFNFNATEVTLDSSMAIFATLRPGQFGRTELPSSLKALFRPAACSTPDLHTICSVKLQLFMLVQYKKLASKVTKFCELCSDKLSKQKHYEFGLLQLSTILCNLEKLLATVSINEDNEEQIVFTALQNSTVHKLCAEDVNIYKEIVKDVFPRTRELQIQSEYFSLVRQVIDAQGWQVIESQIEKTVYLLETLRNSNSALILGESGVGKSVIIKIALKVLKDKVPVFVSPKAISSVEFFGHVQSDKYSDGLFPHLFKAACDARAKSVFVFDSQVDSNWIGCMDSVLDIHQCVTLLNGDKLFYDRGNLSFIFESGNFSSASPSILPRSPIIYVNKVADLYHAIWATGINSNFHCISSELDALYQTYVPHILKQLALDNVETIVPFSEINALNQLLDVLQVLQADHAKNLKHMFLQALYLSIGSHIVHAHDRDKFDALIKEKTKNQGQSQTGDILPKTSLFEFLWDDATGCWTKWKEESTDDAKRGMISTPLTAFHHWLMNKFCERNFRDLVFREIKRPLVLIGCEGSSKTLMIQSFIEKLNPLIFLGQRFNFSLQTTARDVRNAIKSVMHKRTQNIMQPEDQKKLILFLDDLNMPTCDQFGSQESIEFLRVLFQEGGLYCDGPDYDWVELKEIGFIGSITSDTMTPAKLDPRFIAKLNLIYTPKLTDKLLHFIYSRILSEHLQNFTEEVKQLSEDIVTASLHLFKVLNHTLPPTPARWMCHIGVRDLTSLFGGLCQTKPLNFTKPETFVRAWRHEVNRVFYDRLETSEDQKLIEKLIEDAIKHYFEPFEAHTLRDPVLFGDFRNALTQSEEKRCYEDLLDFEAVFFLFQEVLEEYNKQEREQKLDIVLFDSALEHLSRLHRVLRMRRGHAVLIGEPGTGRKSIFTLAATAAQYETFRLPFAVDAVEKAVKQMYRLMGVEKTDVALFVSDADLKQPGISEIIYHAISNGWIPGLFDESEKDEIIQRIGKEKESSDKTWSTFQKDCVSRLHVVLSMQRETLLSLTHEYPEFLTFTMLDWYRSWNENALQKVAKYHISNVELIPENRKAAVLNHVWSTHMMAHEMYNQSSTTEASNCSPKLYVDFIKLFLRLLHRYSREIETKFHELQTALAKLKVANDAVLRLTKLLEEKSKQLDENRSALGHLLNQVLEVNELREKKIHLHSEWDRGIERQIRIIASERIQVQRILDCALPELSAAKQAMQNIKQEQLENLRSFLDEPLESFKTLCDSVFLLQTEKISTVQELKEIFSDAEGINKLALMDCENISHSTCRKVKVKLKKCGNLEELFGKCPVTKTIAEFVNAVLHYCNVLREVKPKLEQIASSKAELAESEKRSSIFRKEVEEVEERLRVLEGKRASMEQKLDASNNATDEIRSHLNRTQSLFSSLESERTKMESDMEQSREEASKLIGDCLLTAAFVSYCGPLSPLGPRKDLVQNWARNLTTINILHSDNFTPEKYLDLRDIRENRFVEWDEMDDATLHNFLLVFCAVRAPLCIDPQQQAAEWIKAAEKELVLASAFDCDLVEKVEGAMVAGKPVLLQDVSHSISSALFDLLDKIYLENGTARTVKIGDNIVQLNTKFRIYFNTREANSKLDADVFSRTTVIDCTMTAQALEEVLAKDVIKVKNAKRFEKRRCYKLQWESLKRKLSELHVQLVQSLVRSTDTIILDDQHLLSALEETKREIDKASAEEKILLSAHGQLDSVCDEFSAIARRSAILFSVLADLAHMGATYLFSLTTFRELMISSLAEADAKENDGQSANVADIITMNVHSFTCRSLFAEHQLPFTLALILRIQLSNGEISSDEGHSAVSELKEKFPNVFGSLLNDLDSDGWKKWINDARPETRPIPLDYAERLSKIQKLLLVKALRSDRVIPALLDYIADIFGPHFITPIIPSMRSLLSESTAKVPIIFIVSGGGVDPSMELHRLSRQMGLDRGQFVSLALGKGSEKNAMAALENAIRRGQWLLLVNCHLVPNLPALVWCQLDQSSPHEKFRLWITTDRSTELPPILLHNALKVVLETPRGLKLKLNSTFRKIEPEVMGKSKHSDFGKILYALAHFHATIQERGEFKNVGWNLKYIFAKPDFDACAAFLGKFLAAAPVRKIPWESIQVFMEKVVYGAHMTDTYDLRVVRTYLQEFCGAHIFAPKFAFYQDENITYGLPNIQNLFGILAYVQNLPLNYSPVVLGLHSNADVEHNKQSLKSLVMNLAKLQPQPILREDVLAHQTELVRATQRIRQLVPENVDPARIKRAAKCMSALENFVAQEIDIFNHLLDLIRFTLDALENAMKGKGKLTRELKESQAAIMENQVPEQWKVLGPPCNKKLAPWLKHLQRRFQQYYDWVMKHEPLVAWLPGLSNPRSYLLSILQMACRKYHWPIEQAGLEAVVTKTKHLPALKDGTYVKGIYIQHGGWDAEKRCLQPAEVCVLSQSLPVLQITAVKNTPEPHGHQIRMPLYFTSSHTTHTIWEFDLPCSEHPSTFILHGTKLVLSKE
ncbi:Hypothetical predicted protein [Cloeon dipterum]|uniref:Uncharacterized protein n=3 Tax=Cloeon dipterum TaxID=197152 RepID=A0A8S1BVD8_9INSE|nr:Hypothetical predicted protein [Cloeon dipterum]